MHRLPRSLEPNGTSLIDGQSLRSIGCRIVCSPEAAAEIADRLCEILDEYTDDDVRD
ncbi:hypothetical protein ACWHLZ_34590 [Streptomyces chartreusis]